MVIMSTSYSWLYISVISTFYNTLFPLNILNFFIIYLMNLALSCNRSSALLLSYYRIIQLHLLIIYISVVSLHLMVCTDANYFLLLVVFSISFLYTKWVLLSMSFFTRHSSQYCIIEMCIRDSPDPILVLFVVYAVRYFPA